MPHLGGGAGRGYSTCGQSPGILLGIVSVTPGTPDTPVTPVLLVGMGEFWNVEYWLGLGVR